MNNAVEIAVSGMRAAQLGIEVTAHNVANVNSTGYTRQRVNLVAATTLVTRSTLIGGGVDVAGVQRIADEFTARQIRNQTTSLGYHSTLYDRLSDVEAIFNEVRGGGLGDSFNAFYDAIADLAGQPEDSSIRQMVLNTGQHVASSLQQYRQRVAATLKETRQDINYQIDQVNNKLTRLAELNGLMAGATKIGINVSDLQDQRDVLLEELSSQLNCSMSVDGGTGMASIAIDGQAILLGVTARHLKATAIGVEIEESGEAVTIESGEIGALLELRDQVLPDYITKLDNLATAVIDQFNAIHSTYQGLDGSTGLDLFTGNDASDIAVNSVILAAPEKLAVSGTGEVGDNAGAQALLDARELGVASLGGASFEDYHRSIVSAIASETAAAQGQDDGINVILDQLRSRRDSTNGVSIDEELTNLIRFQQAYNASARLVSIVDEMIQTLLNLGR